MTNRRELTAETVAALKGWAKENAALFIQDRVDGQVVQRSRGGKIVDVRRSSRDWIMLQFYNMTFKDEFDFIIQEFKGHLGAAALNDFELRLAKLEPRTDAVFQQMLDEKRPAGYQPKKD